MGRPRKAEGEHYRTPIRSYRSPDAIYDPAKLAAEQNGETVTDVINRALVAYAKKHGAGESSRV